MKTIFASFIILFIVLLLYDKKKNADNKQIDDDIDNKYVIKESKEIVKNYDKSIQIINQQKNIDSKQNNPVSNEISIGTRINDYILLERITYIGLKSQISSSYLEYESIPQEEIDIKIGLTNNINSINIDNNPVDNSRLISDGYEQDSRLFNGNLLTKLKEVKMNLKYNQCLNDDYCIDDLIFHGGHGDVYRASHVKDNGVLDSSYILKRMRIKDRLNIHRCALREIYYGNLLKNCTNVAYFYQYFIIDDDYWLVFKNEGTSLESMLYVVTYTGTSAIMASSSVWKKLRTSKDGLTLIKGLMHQIIISVGDLHDRDIIHRDLKPSNIILNTDNGAKLILADFSSAYTIRLSDSNGDRNGNIDNDNDIDIDKDIKGLYGIDGPLVDEETLLYSPPEVTLSIDTANEIPFSKVYPKSYDIWSIGVIFLELLLGTGQVFTTDQRTAALINHKLCNSNDKVKSNALLLASLADYCIYNHDIDKDINNNEFFYKRKNNKDNNNNNNRRKQKHIWNEFDPDYQPKNNNKGVNNYLNDFKTHKAGRCGIEEFKEAILYRDPYGKGFNDKWGLDLLFKLLKYHPADRISMTDARNHAYFVGAFVSSYDGSEFGTVDELNSYNLQFIDHLDHDSVTHDSVDHDNVDHYNVDHNSVHYSNVDRDNVDHDSVNHDVFSNVINSVNEYKENINVDTDNKNDKMINSNQQDHHLHDNHHHNSHFNHYEIDPNSNYNPNPNIITDVVDNLNFTCPSCGRKFANSYKSCEKHVISRKHGVRCLYNASEFDDLPCISDHSLLLVDKNYGYCDLKGRRLYIEDMHSMIYRKKYSYYGIYDGHYGNYASKYLSINLHLLFHTYLNELIHAPIGILSNLTGIMIEDSIMKMDSINYMTNWRDTISLVKSNSEIIYNTTNQLDNTTAYLTSQMALTAMNRAYIDINNKILNQPGDGGKSGSTATTVVLFESHLLIANVGDSRVVLCCTYGGSPIQLTTDHTLLVPKERNSVIDKGGWIEKDDNSETLRVNGHLAVTRSIGDRYLRNVIDSEPDQIILRLQNRTKLPQILTLKSKHFNLNLLNMNIKKYINNNIIQEGITVNFCDIYRNNINFISNQMNNNNHNNSQLFLIVASDGLYDVISNNDATELVCEFLNSQLYSNKFIYRDVNNIDRELDIELDIELDRELDSDVANIISPEAMHKAARLLAREALIRGSRDNIGVCIVNLYFND